MYHDGIVIIKNIFRNNNNKNNNNKISYNNIQHHLLGTTQN